MIYKNHQTINLKTKVPTFKLRTEDGTKEEMGEEGSGVIRLQMEEGGDDTNE